MPTKTPPKTEAPTVNCVQLKRAGARYVQQQIAELTPEQELAFWDEGTQQLQERRQQMQAARRHKGA